MISKGTHFELKKDKGNSGFERVRFTKNKPEMVMGKWSDEIQMQVAYKKVGRVGKQKASKVEWGSKADDEMVRGYELPNGDYEFEVELKKKPTTNTFDFTITGAENLDFFYQPALTQEEIDEGGNRPDNIIGSYAVYHKTKKNHIQGQTNYKTGKAFHIYRPKIIDANNNEVWGELDITGSTLKVTVPQSFLDTAVYPVIVDPTFGYTTAGGTQHITIYQRTQQRNAPENGDVTSISAYLKEGTATLAGAAIYSDSLSLPNSLLAQDTGNMSLGATAVWETANISLSVTNGTNYWLALFPGGGSSISYYYDSTTGENLQWGPLTSSDFENWADPYGTPSGNYTDRDYSIYATYTASATNSTVQGVSTIQGISSITI